MKIFVTGAMGQLGHDVVKELQSRRHEVVISDTQEALERAVVSDKSTDKASWAADSDKSTDKAGCTVDSVTMVALDITDEAAALKAVREAKPDVIIHCAAWTAVDAAEDPANQEKVQTINVSGTLYLARAAKAIDAAMIYVSTDYVFGGNRIDTTPHKEEDRTEPMNFYGKSKWMGEMAVERTLEKYFIVRTSWVFGKNGRNFVKTMLAAGEKNDEVRVVCDQVGTPTYTKDLARIMVDMAESTKYGCYHVTNEGGFISWYEFCVEFYRQAGRQTRVIPIRSEQFKQNKAQRPSNSRLDKSKLKEAGFTPLPTWQDAVHRYLIEIGEIYGKDHC